MQPIATIADLGAIYGDPVPAALAKVVDRITPTYRAWIGAARFVVLGTVGPDGTDTSPRGDDGAVVQVADDRTLLLPDWMGNNRIDSLRNIVADGRVSLMFMVPGSPNVVRVNGTAIVTADAAARARFDRDGKQPRTVIAITVAEAYFQCAKAVMRSGLWRSGDESAAVPSAGDFLAEVRAIADAGAYDAAYSEQAVPRMW